MKLLSLNCGGLVGFMAYTNLETYFKDFKDCDVILLQELRVDEINQERLIPVLNLFKELLYPYYAIAWSEKGNGGCITFSKSRLTEIEQESRSILVTQTEINDQHYLIVNCYIPNYGYGEGIKKKDFIKKSRKIFPEILSMGSKIPVIIAGDFNAAFSVSHCKCKNKPGVFKEEVEWINELLEKNNLCIGDVTASIVGSKGEFYTYYSFRGRSKNTSHGPLGSMRIDHVLVSGNSSVKTIVYNTKTERDHFPIISTVLLKNSDNAE